MNFDEAKNIYLNSADAESRRNALSIISSGDLSEEIIYLLSKGASDSDRGIQDICYRKLASLPDEYKSIAARMISEYITSDDLDTLSFAGELLIRLDGYSVEHLAPYLNHNSSDVRKFACDLIGTIYIEPVSSNNYNIHDKIIELLNDSEINVRAAAIEALGNIKNLKSLEILKNIYDVNEDFKALIIEAIGKIGSRIAEEFILSKLGCEDDIFLKISCIDSLGLCAKIPNTYSKLMSIMRNELNEFSNYLNHDAEKFAINTSGTGVEYQSIILKNLYVISKRCRIEFKIGDDLRHVAHYSMLDYNNDIREAGFAALGNKYELSDLPFILKSLLEYKTTFKSWITSEKQSLDYGIGANENITRRHTTFVDNNIESEISILKNILINSENIIVKEFFKLFLSSKKPDNTANIELLSKISLIWDEIKDARKELIFESVMTNILSIETEFENDIKELLQRIDKKLFNKVLKKIKNER